MTNAPIRRSGEDLQVVLWRDGWPRTCTIFADGQTLRMTGTAQIMAVHFMLGEVLAADDQPDDRPRIEVGAVPQLTIDQVPA